jgi:hypothetical protein
MLTLPRGDVRSGDHSLATQIGPPSLCAKSACNAKQLGIQQDGVRVSLSLDKLRCAVGEDIPLRIAAQVVSGKGPVYGEPDRLTGAFFIKWDFSPVFHLTLNDEAGLIVGNNGPSNLRFVIDWSSGPLVCPPAPLEVGHV